MGGRHARYRRPNRRMVSQRRDSAFGIPSKEKEKNGVYCSFRMGYLLLGRSLSGVRVVVGVDIFKSESASLKIRGLRGPGCVVFESV